MTLGHRVAFHGDLVSVVHEAVEDGVGDGAVAEEIVDRIKRGLWDSGNSMYADRVAGRPTEYDARNGVIAGLEKKHTIAAPMNELMVSLLEAAQGMS